jgi:hypothetical protein
MEDLPREMLNEILLLLDKPSLFQASNTCKLWRQQTLIHVVIINTMPEIRLAAENGDRLSIIKSACNTNSYLNWGLYGACKGGHEDLVKLMIAKGAFDFYWGLYGACLGGHKNLAELMITKRIQDCGEWFEGEGLKDHRDFLNQGLKGTCEGGHEDLAELMISRGARKFNWGLYGACKGGHKNLAKLMIAKGAKKCQCGKSLKDH